MLVTVCTDTHPGMRLPFAMKVTLPVVDVAAVSVVEERNIVFAGVFSVTLELSGVVGVTGIFMEIMSRKLVIPAEPKNVQSGVEPVPIPMSAVVP